jgi:hypothetical protein
MIRITVRTLSLFVLVSTLAVPAMAYNLVNSSLPQLNCDFNTTCTVTVTDMASDIPGTNGGKLQSRIFQGQPGSPLAGKWCYEYRVNMVNSVGILSIPYVTGMSVAGLGTLVAYDYNFDGTYTDQVFVITQGGIGSIGLASTYAFWGISFFNLSSAVSGGAYAGAGQSSYFFGYVSDYAPTTKSATVQTDQGSQTVTVYAPNVP